MSKPPTAINSIKTKLTLLIVLFGSLSFLSAHAGISDLDGADVSVLDGAALFKVSRGYIAVEDDDKSNDTRRAALDAMLFMGYVCGVLDASRMVLPEGVTAGQVIEIVANFLKTHPELRHKTASSLVELAFAEKFPQQ